MNKYQLSVLLVLITINFAVGQEVSKQMLTGKWHVVQVATSDKNLTSDVEQSMEYIKKGLMNAKLNFQSNGKFTIELHKNAPDSMTDLKFLNNKDWKYNPVEKLISVGTQEDDFNHLRMYVKKEGGKIYFAFNDTPLTLEVKKI